MKRFQDIIKTRKFSDRTRTLIALVLCACLIVAGLVSAPHVQGPGASPESTFIAALDKTAVSRTEEEEGDIHYFDEEAVALAGEASLSESIMTELEKVVAQVNAIRANSGLHPLTLSASLSSAAQVRAMECERAFSHTRPDGSAWWTVNSTMMYGENLAKNYYDSGSVVAAWMASPTHAANILGGFNTIGLGLHQTSNGTWYWAQEFGF